MKNEGQHNISLYFLFITLFTVIDLSIAKSVHSFTLIDPSIFKYTALKLEADIDI
jgi:hypothetical protein